MAERGRTLGYWRGRLQAAHRDGTVLDCGFRAFPVTGVGGNSVVMALASRGDELDRVKTNLAFLDSLFETCPIGLAMFDEELRYLHLNQALADMNGLPIEEHLGRRLAEIMITSDGGEYERMLRAVVAEGKPVAGVRVGMRTRGHPDRDKVLSVSFFPLTQAVGTRQGVGGLLVDVTDREQAIVEATATRQRLALLNRASARIGTTLDVQVTAQELVEAAVPDFADAAVVELVEWKDEHAAFDPALPVDTHRIAHGTVLPPPATELVSGLEAVHYPPGSAIHRMLRTGRPLCVPVNQEFMARTMLSASRARLLADSGLACLLLAPLIARGTVQGIAVFGRSAARPTFTEQDLGLAGELASRAALCLDNARLYSRERNIALTLQRALLPTSLVTGPHLHLAHRYLPGSRVTEVGGDWYDVISSPAAGWPWSSGTSWATGCRPPRRWAGCVSPPRRWPGTTRNRTSCSRNSTSAPKKPASNSRPASTSATTPPPGAPGSPAPGTLRPSSAIRTAGSGSSTTCWASPSVSAAAPSGRRNSNCPTPPSSCCTPTASSRRGATTSTRAWTPSARKWPRCPNRWRTRRTVSSPAWSRVPRPTTRSCCSHACTAPSGDVRR